MRVLERQEEAASPGASSTRLVVLSPILKRVTGARVCAGALAASGVLWYDNPRKIHP